MKLGCAQDETEKRFALTTIKTLGMSTKQLRILKYTPSFKGQEPAEIGDPDDKEAKTYNFILIKAKEDIMTAAGSIGMYSGPGADDVSEMFLGWRHSGIKDR